MHSIKKLSFPAAGSLPSWDLHWLIVATKDMHHSSMINCQLLVVYCSVNLLQDGKGKDAVPLMRLNVVRLLAELCVCLKRWEVVDMILPLFIEHLEEGDASSPSLLRLRVCNFVLLLTH